MNPAEPAAFAPTASWEMLRRRGELLRQVRQFFHGRGFLEVETPLLSADTVVDRHLDPLPVLLLEDPRRLSEGRPMWLQTSPEFGMKRLLAAGGEAIYQITRSFRAGERGPLHNPEFTLVEWYRRGDDYAAGIGLLSDLAEALLGRGPAERLTYATAMERHAGVDPHAAPVAALAEALAARGGTPPRDLDPEDPQQRDAWLDLLLVHCVAPHLGRGAPTILCDYPPSQAALARIRRQTPPVAERFELFVDGVELANGYHELLDAEALLARNRAANAQRLADGKYRLPEESRLVAAMRGGLPPSAGCALGLDRLLMVLTGARHIDQVLAFPVERA